MDRLADIELVEPPPGAAACWTPLKPTEALLRGFEVAALAAAEPPGAVDTAPTPAARGVQQRQGFRLGTIGMMVDYAQGSELTELPRVHRLPHAPAWFAGICNLHGALIPVFDLARRLGIERDAHAKPMLLVLGHGADAAGVVVDGLPQRLRFDEQQWVDPVNVPASLAHWVTAAALIGERLWLDLSVPALLAGLSDPTP